MKPTSSISSISSTRHTEEEATQTLLKINQMDCPTEENLIRQKLAHLSVVQSLEFNLLQRTLRIQHHAQSLDEIIEAINSLGLQTEIASAASETDQLPQTSHWKLILAGLFTFAAEMAHWLNSPIVLIAFFALCAIALSGITTYKKGWIAIKMGNLNINALMSIAVTGAVILGQWSEAAAVMVLFSLAEKIESYSLDRVRQAINNLLKLAPDTVTVKQEDGSWQKIHANHVSLGQYVRVAPGERIGLDGQITQGHSSIDQSTITGESLPVDKNIGDMVFAGTINQLGSFEYLVTTTAENTMLAHIIHSVESAQSKKAPTQRFVDRFARWYTPSILGIALVIATIFPLVWGGSWQDWIYTALVLLVIACPCALVIATPITIVSGLAKAAKRGILVKGGRYLEEARLLKWLVFDKTGTITVGKPQQTDYISVPHSAVKQSLPFTSNPQHIAASLAHLSHHPVSQAIYQYAFENNISPLLDVNNFIAHIGKGISGDIHDQTFYLGNLKWIKQLNLLTDSIEEEVTALEKQGKTVVILANSQQILALFAVADVLKTHSQDTIKHLNQMGIKTMMLSGDNTVTVEAIAKMAGITQALGQQLPEDKLNIIDTLSKTDPVGMVGDGINDTPALARAHIGFSMGILGSDSAIETADVALMDDDLRKIPELIQLSQRTHSILMQNIVLALGIKAIFLLLTMAGLGTLWMAVFADVGASLIVIANGLRLLR